MWIAQLPQCAPSVHPVTMVQVVRVESGGNPLALHVNGLSAKQQPHPATTSEAISDAKAWIGRGYNVDVGLAQINSRNLPALGLTLEHVLGTSDAATCANLRAGAAILTTDYGRAAAQVGPGQLALAYALSAYNAGDFTRGFQNGYVAKYFTIPFLTLPEPPRVFSVSTKRHSADTEVW